jgi:hypothetical protein
MQAVAAIRAGDHRCASNETVVAWAHRLLYGGRLLWLPEQRMLLRLLVDAAPAGTQLAVASALIICSAFAAGMDAGIPLSSVYDKHPRLDAALQVRALGGVAKVFARFWQHYEVRASPRLRLCRTLASDYLTRG